MASRTAWRSWSVQLFLRWELQLTQRTRTFSGSSRRDRSSLSGITWSTLNASVLPHSSQNGDCRLSRWDKRRQRQLYPRAVKLACGVRVQYAATCAG
jgi:hypothetical protein